MSVTQLPAFNLTVYPSWLAPDLIAAGGGLSWKFAFDGDNTRVAEYWRKDNLGTQSEMLADVRNSLATDYDADGTLRSYGVNVPAIPLGVGLVPRGQRGNKCTNYNANPTNTAGISKAGNANAVLSVVDDSAELAAAGLDGICTSGMAFKLDNSLGGATTSYIYIPGFSGNTNPHTISAYMRSTGSARLILSSSGGTGWGQSGGYVRRSATVTPANATQQIVIEVAVGAVVYFILNQLEEGSYATPPIVTEGSAATRLADSITAPNFAADAAALGLGDGVEFELSTTVERLGASSTRHVFALGSGSPERFDLYIDTSNVLTLRRYQSGNTVTRTKTLTATGTYEITGRVTADEIQMSVNGEDLGTIANSYGVPPMDELRLGQSITDGNALNGPLRELQLWRAAA